MRVLQLCVKAHNTGGTAYRYVPTDLCLLSRLTLNASAGSAELGDGYGFPSSHSQWMGYFASFLFLHFALRHRFVSTGFAVLDYARIIFLYAFILGWSCAVAFSRYVLTTRLPRPSASPRFTQHIARFRRYYLSYHSGAQVCWGFGIGVAFGTTYYILLELVPTRWPNAPLGRLRAALLTHPLCAWFRLRDGWAVWADAGTEAQYLRWRAEWDARRATGQGGDAVLVAKKTQ